MPPSVATKTHSKLRSPSPEPKRRSPEVERRPASPLRQTAEAPKRPTDTGKQPPPPPPAPEEPEDDGENLINMETFQQILELDEDETHDFSWTIADSFFQQAKGTFKDMDEAFAAKELKKLSQLGHFLKGSSAALGVTKVQDACEKIQHYGHLRDEDANVDLTPEAALKKIGPLLTTVKSDFEAARKWFRGWYADHGVEEAFDD